MGFTCNAGKEENPTFGRVFGTSLGTLSSAPLHRAHTLPTAPALGVRNTGNQSKPSSESFISECSYIAHGLWKATDLNLNSSLHGVFMQPRVRLPCRLPTEDTVYPTYACHCPVRQEARETDNVFPSGTLLSSQQVKTKDESRSVGRISKQWGGLLREALTDADDFGLQFPLDLDVRVKAVLLGATFLIVSWRSLPCLLFLSC